MKKVLIALGVILALVILAVIIIPFLIPVEKYKEEIAAQVKSSTGRDFVIAGPLSLSLFPNIALSAEDVRFANWPASKEPQMATLKELKLSVALMPLLSGKMQIKGFTLVEPVIHLERDKNGRGNWEFDTAAKEPASPEPAESGDIGSMIEKLQLGDFRISNGLVTYLDPASGPERMEVKNINLRASLPAYDAPFKGEGDLVWKGKKVALAISTNNLRNLMEGRGEKVAASINSDLIDFSLDGTARMGDAIEADGKAKLSTPSIRELAAWLAEPLEAPGTGLGPLSIGGDLAVRENRYGFTNVDLALDALRAKGGVTLETGGARPMIRGELVTDALDLNPYLPPEPEETPEWTGWSTEPMDLSGLKAADMALSFRTGSLKFRDITIGKSDLELNLKNGVLAANLKEMALYEGTGSGSLTVDASGSVPAIAAKFDLAGVAGEPLLRDAGGFERLSGSLKTNFSLAGRGASQKDIVSSLNGNGAFTFTDGTLKGVDLAEIAGIIEQIANGAKTGGADLLKNLTSGNLLGSLQGLAAMFGGRGEVNKSTKFTSLSATFQAKDGVIHNDDLKMVGPLVNQRALLTMSGAGDINLGTTGLAYEAEVRSFAKQEASGGIGGRVRLSGTIMEPAPCVVLGSMCIGKDTGAGDIAKDKLKGMLQDKLQGGKGEDGADADAPAKTEDKVKGLFDKLKKKD